MHVVDDWLRMGGREYGAKEFRFVNMEEIGFKDRCGLGDTGASCKPLAPISAFRQWMYGDAMFTIYFCFLAYSKQIDLISRFYQPHTHLMENSFVINRMGVTDMAYSHNCIPKWS